MTLITNTPARTKLHPFWLNTMLHLFIAICIASMSQTVLAQEFVRPFPVDIKMGVLNLSAGANIEINGVNRQLTAGAQIRDDKNHILQPSALMGSAVKIIYKENSQGQIDRIWILNGAELVKYAKGIPRTP